MAHRGRERSGHGRLSRSGEFDRAYRDGRSHSNRYVVLYAFPRPDAEAEGSRLGLSVGRAMGGAVQRNKVKRALREAFKAVAGRLPEHHDFVLVARPDLGGLVEREGADGVAGCLDEVIRESGIQRRSV
jgi:ribonuclease P protein component